MTLILRSLSGVGVVVCNCWDQYLTKFCSNTNKLFANADAAADANANTNANPDAGGSTIAIPGLRPGELKINVDFCLSDYWSIRNLNCHSNQAHMQQE